MRLLLPALAMLLAAPGASALSADAPADVAEAWDGCVQYMYIADYHWYWVCVAPKDPSCPVYFKEQHGVTVTKECVVETRPDAAALAAPEAACIPTSGGLDYPSWLCVDPSDPKCAVYTVTTSDWGVQKRCYGVLGATAAGAGNPLEDHDRDGDMEVGKVCVWGFSDGCVVPAYECFQPYRPGFGITCI